jgi:hypothetical protein
MRNAIRTLAGLGLAAALLAGCSFTYPTPRKFAILFGINLYPAGNDLSYPVADANSMEAMLVANGFAPTDVYKRTDGAATKVELGNLLASIVGQAAASDLVLFYYSGHGTVYPVNGADAEWILPSGSISGGGAFVPSNAIYDKELGDMLAVLPTQRRVVILDSCNSGGLIGSGLEADTVESKLYGNTAFDGVVTIGTIIEAIGNYATFTTTDNGGVSPYKALTIAAAGADELSFESSSPPYSGHGVLTHFLLQAPADGDLNGDGLVTVLEMFALAKAGIDSTWNVVWKNTNYVFSPHVSGGPIDLVLF